MWRLIPAASGLHNEARGTTGLLSARQLGGGLSLSNESSPHDTTLTQVQVIPFIKNYLPNQIQKITNNHVPATHMTLGRIIIRLLVLEL